MSATHVGPDAMVTVKVTYDGTTRRVKMPLREMVPRVLEEHVRFLSPTGRLVATFVNPALVLQESWMRSSRAAWLIVLPANTA